MVEEYIVAVKTLHDGNGHYPKSNLLGLMNRNVRKIDFTDIQSYEDIVAYSIGYFPERRNVRASRKQSTDKASLQEYPSYNQRELALNLLRIALDKKGGDIYDHIYFTAIKQFVANDEVDEAGFIRDFLPAYINVIKENESYSARELWQELPDWVVTKELLSKKALGGRTS